MYLDYYGKNIYNSIVIPVYLYEIKASTLGKDDKRLDVLGKAIIDLLDGEKIVDINYILNTLGIPYKYKKLIQAEINELRDNGNIITDANNEIESISKYADANLDSYYVIYDRTNKTLLDCIISKNEVDKKLKKNSKVLTKEKNYFINNENRYAPDRFDICAKISDLISRANRSNDEQEESINKDVDEIYRPFYNIFLETVENLENPIECDFLIKVALDKEMNIIYESPFTKDNYSVYISKNIMPKIDKDNLRNMLNNFDFFGDELTNEVAIKYINKYKLHDKDKVRLEYIEQIAFYQAALTLEGDKYKALTSPIICFDKIVKSQLKEITDKFDVSKINKENVKIREFTSLEKIKDLKIIKVVLNEKVKVVKKDKQFMNPKKAKSIVSYLQAIYGSKFCTNSMQENKYYEAFSNNFELNRFLNEVWQYRNNSGHNIEKGNNYIREYDLDFMEKERLKEILTELGEGLIEFIETVRKI